MKDHPRKCLFLQKSENWTFCHILAFLLGGRFAEKLLSAFARCKRLQNVQSRKKESPEPPPTPGKEGGQAFQHHTFRSQYRDIGIKSNGLYFI